MRSKKEDNKSKIMQCYCGYYEVVEFRLDIEFFDNSEVSKF